MGQQTEAEWAKRVRLLVHLLGIQEVEATDASPRGRLAIIIRLKAAKAAEVERGRTGSWLYDVNRHLNLCSALRAEYEALAFSLGERDGHEAQAARAKMLAQPDR